MSKILTVDLPGRAYDIEIERGLLDRVGERCKAVLPRAKALFVVTDSTVGPLYGQRVLDSLEKAGFDAVLHTVPAGEESKCVERLQELWEAMMDAGLTRTDAVAALGGGVVGAIFFAVVFLIGHSMNMAINLLGAYVHTNRLQFVEFFGKFYVDGGKPFRPLEINTRYVDVENHNF